MLGKLVQTHRASKEYKEHLNPCQKLWSPALMLVVPLSVVQPMTCLLAVDDEIRIEAVSEQWETL